MRKILLISLVALVAMPGTSWGINHCRPSDCMWGGAQRSNLNAHLLTTDGTIINNEKDATAAYNARKKCFKCNYKMVGPGCNENTFITFGWGKTFQCRDDGEYNDDWVKVGKFKNMCSDSPVKKGDDSNATYQIKSTSTPIQETDEYMITEHVCIYGECNDGFLWDESTKKCIQSVTITPKNSQTQEKKQETKKEENKTKQKDSKKDNKEQQTKIPCKEQRKGNPEGMACCDVKDATWKNNKCVCNDKNKEFVFGNGKTPACVVKTKPNDQGAKAGNGDGDGGQPLPPANECKGYPTEDFSKWATAYGKIDEIKKAIDDIKENCDDKKITDEEYKNKYDTLKKQIQDYNEKFVDANQGLWSLISADRSVWRDKEGNINKARLASDGVGAVVLGTTSALITGHVMKKKQVEKGMDSIRCVVGGQVVADWGDDFVIRSEY